MFPTIGKRVAAKMLEREGSLQEAATLLADLGSEGRAALVLTISRSATFGSHSGAGGAGAGADASGGGSDIDDADLERVLKYDQSAPRQRVQKTRGFDALCVCCGRRVRVVSGPTPRIALRSSMQLTRARLGLPSRTRWSRSSTLPRLPFARATKRASCATRNWTSLVRVHMYARRDTALAHADWWWLACAPGLKPSICEDAACAFSYEELGLGLELRTCVTQTPDLVDLLISFLWSACKGGRVELMFPTQVRPAERVELCVAVLRQFGS